MNLFQHDATRPHRRQLRRKRTQPRRNEVGVHKNRALRLAGQKFLCKCCLARTVRPGNDQNLSFTHKNQNASAFMMMVEHFFNSSPHVTVVCPRLFRLFCPIVLVPSNHA
jgi:hypothetical protein